MEILCCPEGVLGGLADYAIGPTAIAIDVEGGQLDDVLAPLASDTVTTILGFTEIVGSGRLYNSAAVLHKGSVIGLYRKVHPAIHRSVYQAGDEFPVFTIGDFTFGIIICLDSTYVEPARTMASRGAAALFVPTNNGLPHARAHTEVASEARRADIVLATENGTSAVRADVAGRTDDLMTCGSSGIVDRAGIVLQSAQPFSTGIIVADIDTAPARLRV